MIWAVLVEPSRQNQQNTLAELGETDTIKEKKKEVWGSEISICSTRPCYLVRLGGS